MEHVGGTADDDGVVRADVVNFVYGAGFGRYAGRLETGCNAPGYLGGCTVSGGEGDEDIHW
ncbi:hypothetical protein StoSoilB5_24350 [Arthrobacter sp. StoSoilB5]|nr:hypothetical protein StoSoilB5_24350 [Arthrobacter sp. StoSoilB5]